MSEQELVDVLSVHADSLKDGVDLTDELLAAKTAAEEGELQELLQLARQVREALAPVAPRSDFVMWLKGDLLAQARRSANLKGEQAEVDRHKWLGLAAAVGALIYFAGLTWVSVKWSLTVLSFLAGLVGLRSMRAASPKTRLVQ